MIKERMMKKKSENKIEEQKLQIAQVDIDSLNPSEYNPRTATEKEVEDLKESMRRFGIPDPLIVNNAENRKNIIIGGHLRLKVAKELGKKTVPVVYVNIPDIKKEQELNLRLNKNLGHFDYDLLANFDENLLKDVGFDSAELDDVFEIDLGTPENFDIQKELEKLKISKIQTRKGDIYKLGSHRLMCGDSSKREDIQRLMDGGKASMCFTDPPYILDYLSKKYKGKSATKGFGYRTNRQYLETDEAIEFEQWMPNIKEIAKPDFHIIVYENWKNVIPLWQEMEKHWKIRNLIIWHLANRCQGFAAKYRFFNKYDIALYGVSEDNPSLNLEEEPDKQLESEYELALYATQGKPYWEGYKKGKRFCPTDFIEFKASDEQSSGQAIIFGTKPVEILVPYIKVLTKRDEVIVEPFGGSGSTLIACEKMKRSCYTMELVPTYCEVIIKRWENLTEKKAEKINGQR